MTLERADTSTGPGGGCPVAHVEPFDREYLEDPYRAFAALRAKGPVHFDPDLEMWAVTRYADIEAIFKDPKRFSASIAQSPVSPLDPAALDVLSAPGGPLAVMSSLDPPEHSRIRKLNMETFSARRIAVLETTIQARVDELVADLPTDGEADLVSALTFPVPALTIFALLGFPESDAEQLKAWSDDRMFLIWGQLEPERQVEIARNFRAFYDYCVAHVQGRLADPQDDFTSDLVRIHREKPDAISAEEIASVVFGLSFAGHETTTNLLSNCIRNLVTRREIWQALCADPELIPAAVEEVLRLDSSVICWRRVTTEPVTIGGVEVPAGAKLLLLLGSANRDPDVFEDPDAFRLDRPNATRHMSLGRGIHFCLGAPLARLQGKIVLEALVTQRPNITVDPNQPLEFPANVSFRGPKRLLASCPAV